MIQPKRLSVNEAREAFKKGENKRLTIYDIKRLTAESSPNFFSRETMRFFGQTLKMFTVGKCDDGRYFISAPRKHGGRTERFFNPENNTLWFS